MSIEITNKRVKLLECSELIQVVILKIVNDKEQDVIKVTAYGYTTTLAHIEFSYEIPFKTELDRNLTFEEMTPEMMVEDLKRIVKTSRIPILFN
jgi:hypothetical protein